MQMNTQLRQVGRPSVISRDIMSVIRGLYKEGYGYRAIARILRDEHGVDTSFMSVKRVLAKRGIVKSPKKLNRKEVIMMPTLKSLLEELRLLGKEPDQVRISAETYDAIIKAEEEPPECLKEQ